MKHPKRQNYINDESGFASLIIALILVIVLSLLTVGFAGLMRNSQKQALNRHLSSQAYYAAESGINDALRALNNGFDSEKSDCAPYKAGADNPNGWKYLTDNTVDAAGDSTSDSPRWTCLLIDTSPSSLMFNPVSTVTPKSFIFKPIDKDKGSQINTLDIYWQDADKSNTKFRSACSGNSCFPQLNSWKSIGAVRVSLTPLKELNPESLASNTYTAFLYPSSSTAKNSEGVAGKTGLSKKAGSILNGNCSKSNKIRYCHASLTNIPASDAGYMMSMRSIYSPTNVYLEGSWGGQPVSFDGAQVMIDSTGKAQNVLRRTQVRAPSRQNYPWPGFDVEATSGICKRLSAYPGHVSMGC